MLNRIDAMAPPELRATLFTDRYTSVEQLEREKRTVFHKTWMVVARDSDIPRPGDCLPVDELDTSLILVRGDDGVVRAFRNACRHRGTRIVCRARNSGELTCPYHGWTYNLAGKLIRVPGADGFSGLDRDARGLIPVRAASYAGFVWVTFDAGTEPLRQYLGPVAEQLAPYRLEQMRAIRRKTWMLPCNWKALLDANNEKYHISTVHSKWSAALAVERDTFYDLGVHHLFSLSLGNYRWRSVLDWLTTPRNLSISPEQAKLYQRYLVFPNALVAVTPHFMTVFRVFPVTPGSCRFHYEFHVPEGAAPLARLRARLTQLASLRITKEDNAILGLLQRGVVAAVHGSIPLHHEEMALEHFHRVIDRYTDRAEVDELQTKT